VDLGTANTHWKRIVREYSISLLGAQCDQYNGYAEHRYEASVTMPRATDRVKITIPPVDELLVEAGVCNIAWPQTGTGYAWWNGAAPNIGLTGDHKRTNDPAIRRALRPNDPTAT